MDVAVMEGGGGSDILPAYRPIIGLDARRRSIATMTTSPVGPLAIVPPVRSITPSPRLPPLRSADRLYMRLRSNSGLTFHTNEAALDQYTNYQNSGPSRPPSANQYRQHQHEPLHEEDTGSTDLTETLSESPRGAGGDGSVGGVGPIETGGGLQSCLPFLDFLGQDVFQISLDNPAISRQLLRYCEDHGCPEHVEFLLKVQEYNQATDEIASLLTGLATSFTSPAAKNPLNLPPMLARQLNVDIKRMAHTLLPGMETVFLDATRHVKQRIAKDAFPGFVQTQFTHCASTALSSGTHGIGSPKLEYPGLGESFCISAVANPQTVITAASDAFAKLTGYPPSEILSKVMNASCNFMQGPFTDQAAIGRVRAGLREGREVSELILNYRRDGEAFWNLFTLSPLKDQQGRIWYWLGAQIDVSESVTSRRDLLRVLNRGRNPEAPNTSAFAVGGTMSSEEKDENSTVISREGSVRSNSRSGGFLQQFRKNTRSPSPPPTPTAERCNPLSSSGNKSTGPRTRLLAQEYFPRPRGPSILPVNAHYLVLACEQFAPSSKGIQRHGTPTPASALGNGGSSSNSSNNGLPPNGSTNNNNSSSNGNGNGNTYNHYSNSKKRQSLKLNVAFYSDAAAELLCIHDDVTRMGIFQVLEDYANSPSITRSFKAMVRDRIEFGKSVTAEIVVERGRGLFVFGGRRIGGSSHHHHRFIGGGGGGGGNGVGGNGSGNGAGASTNASANGGSRPGSSAELGGDHSRSGSGDKLERKLMSVRSGSSRQEKLMSHWTPLKDTNGDVEWVVLVLAPRSTT